MRLGAFSFGLTVCAALAAAAEKAPTAAEPLIRSVYPLSVTNGSTADVEIRATDVGGVYAVWFEDDALQGSISKVEALPAEPKGENLLGGPEKKAATHRVLLRLNAGRNIGSGVHKLYLVCPTGMSDGVEFRTEFGRVVAEPETAHGSPKQAAPVELSVFVSGKISRPGEVDFYSFHAEKGDELAFEIVSALGITPELSLYRPGGSWLSPDRPIPLLFREQHELPLIPAPKRFTFRAADAGTYLLGIGSLFGIGSADSVYEVLVTKGTTARPLPPPQVSAWEERSFERVLNADWVRSLQRRTVVSVSTEKDDERQDPAAPGKAHRLADEVPAPDPQPAAAARESEPNDTPAEAVRVSFPTIVEGAIERPADIDQFRIHVKRGEQLVFEIQTPAEKPPRFDPELTILDNRGQALLSNLEKRSAQIGTNGHPLSYFKRVDPKLLYTFPAEDDYLLRLRDITFREGSARFAYRLLIRSPVPHVGAVALEGGDDHVNLVRGRTKKLTISAALEEGFTGSLAYTVTGLPTGVTALAADVTDPKPNPETIENEANLLPVMRRASVLLVAADDAPLTSLPRKIEVCFRPVVDGKIGPTVSARELPVMVVAPREDPSQAPQTALK